MTVLRRVSVELLPDSGLAAQREAREKERLASVRAGMGQQEVESIIQETRELKERQVSGPLCVPDPVVRKGPCGACMTGCSASLVPNH